MGFHPHYLPDVVGLVVCLILIGILLVWSNPLPRRPKRIARVVLIAMAVVIAIGAAQAAARVNRRFPGTVVAVTRALGLASAGLLVYGFVLIAGARTVGGFAPERRRALKIAAGVATVVPAAIGTVAFIRRDDLRFREIDVPLPDHARDLHGFRIVQLTDMHMGTLVSERYVRRAVGMANDAKAHVAFVTGDFITSRGDPLDQCLRVLSELRAEAGIYGCNGNHEIYAEAQRHAQERGRKLGIRILRDEALILGWNGATINLAGIDYQRRGAPYLTGAESLLIDGAYNLLLSHNPDLFPVAARKGFDLTIAGHTHGGQVTLEFVHPALNVARFTTPYVHGQYEMNGRRLWVSRGIGTIGVPARLGAPPEVVCLRLCATSS